MAAQGPASVLGAASDGRGLATVTPPASGLRLGAGGVFASGGLAAGVVCYLP